MSEVSIPVEGAVLAARISVPAEGPAPAVVALHGAERVAAWREARGDQVGVVLVPGTGHEPADDEVVSPLYERAMLDWLQRLV